MQSYEQEPWLNQALKFFEEEKLDELVLFESGKVILTQQQINHKTTKIKLSKDFTHELQKFVFKQRLRLDPFSPFAGGKLSCSSFRWHCVMPPVSKESLFFLRKHRFSSLTLNDFCFLHDSYEKIQKIIEDKKSFVIAGPTGSGKTSLLTALLYSYFKEKRVVILEDYDELPVLSNLWFKLTATKEAINHKTFFPLDFLFREVLRMRPDQTVLGELRGTELKTFIELCNSGHQTTCSTMHASSAAELKVRMKMILAKEKISAESILAESNLWVIFLERSTNGSLIRKVEPVLF